MDSKDLQAISELLDKKLGIMQSGFDDKLGNMQSGFDKKLDIMQSGFDNKLENMQSDFNKKFQTIQSQLDEHTHILKALEEASKVHKAGMDDLTHQVAEVRGEITEVRKDLSRIEIATAENWTDIAKLKAVK